MTYRKVGGWALLISFGALQAFDVEGPWALFCLVVGIALLTWMYSQERRADGGQSE
jgi:hypothetical protein